MDDDDFDEFLINKINNSFITVMTFHLLLLKQDIITLLFSHLKQVLPSSWTDLGHLVKQCPTANIKAFFLLCAATMCWQCNSGPFRITRASDTTNNHVREFRAIFVTRRDWCGQGHVSSEGRLSRFNWMQTQWVIMGRGSHESCTVRSDTRPDVLDTWWQSKETLSGEFRSKELLLLHLPNFFQRLFFFLTVFSSWKEVC